MTIADELIARVDADRARENNQGSVIKEIIDRVDADRGPGFLTGTKDVLASAAIGLGNIPKAVTQIGEMATSGSPIFAQGTQAIDNAMNWLRERLVSDETLAQQRQIARTIANDDAAWYDVISQAFRNPAGALTQGAESLSSFAVPAGAGAGAVRGVSALSRALKPTSNIVARTLASVDPRRAQMAALLGTNALMNAGETFSESQGQDIADRYQGAGVSGVASLIGSALTGGAAERTLSNMILRDVLKGGIRERVAGVAKDAAKEGVQEFIEEGGNAVGSNVAKNEDINIGQALRQGAYGALLGAGTGGALGSVNALTAPSPRENSQAQVQATPQQTPSSQQAATQAAAQIGQIAQAARAQAQPQPQPVAEATPQPAPVQQEVTQETTPVPEATPEPTANDNQRVILQNRNRSSDASIQQMNAIAAQPDYLRVAESHDFGNGAPVVAYGQVAPNQLGKRSMSVTSDGERIPVQYAVVEAADVLTSNQVNGSTNAEYESAPATCIRAIAGNGRVAGLAEAYRRGTAGQYRAELREDAGNLGIAPEVIDGMNAPILVRVMPTDRVRADIGDVSNTSGNLALSAVETAANDVNRINFDKIVFNENGEPDVDTVIGFVRQMPISEQGALIDTNGQPTRAAHERFANALFKKAYGDDELVRLTAQAVDPEIRNVIAALSRVAPKMARLEGLGDLDIRGLVKEAAQVVVNAHRQGVSLAKFAAQGDATIDPDAFVIVQCFAKNARSVKEMARVLEHAADFAYSEGTKDDVDMFGEVQRAMRQDVLNRIEEETNGRQQQTAAGSSAARTEAANNRNQSPGPQNLAESTGAEPAQENVQRRADRASADGRGSADAQRTEEAFELTGQTEAEAQAEAARIQEITDNEQREQQEAERRQREERIAREERQAAERYRDEFSLEDDTVTADDAVSGQQGLMFSRAGQQRLAPNGEPSNLTPEQWEQVRTPEFKAWFGDWEKSPETSSKVLDENGEPRVVFHGTNNVERTLRRDPNTGELSYEYGNFESFRPQFDEQIGHFFNSERDNAGSYGSYLYDVFLNLKKPLIIDAHNRNFDAIEYNGRTKDTYEWAAWAKRNGYDGVIFNNIRDGAGFEELSRPTINFVAFRSNQIKSATENNGNFDPHDERIKFSRSAQSWRPEADLVSGIKDYFGTTWNPRESGYMMQDGDMLNMSGSHEVEDDATKRSLRGRRTVDHRELSGTNARGVSTEHFFDDQNIESESDYMYNFMARTGAMRMDYDSGIVALTRQPTRDQLQMMQRMANDNEFLIASFYTPEGRIVDEVEWDGPVTQRKIKEFFAQAQEKADRGQAGAFASVSRADRGGSESVQALRRSLSEDKQLGDAFDRLQDHGVVDVVDSAQDAFARMAMARPAAVEASLSEIPAGEGPARQRVKEIIEQKFPEGAELEVRVDSDQSTIIVGRSGFRHSAFGQRASNETLVATMHAPELIQKSVSDGVRRDKAGKVLNEGEPGGAYVYFSRIDIDGTPHLVRITVKPVSERRGRYYDMKAKKSASGQIGWSGSDALQDTSEASGPSVSEEPIQIKRSDAGDIQAIYDPETGKSYLIAENIKAGDEKGVLVHEVGVHMAADRGGREAMRPLVIRAQQIVFNGNANGDATAKHVYQRLKNADLLNSRGFIKPGFEEEAFAYLAEEMVNSKDKASSPIREWFEKLLSAVRVWLYKRGLFVAAENLSDRDLVSIAVENVRTMARQGNGLQNQSSGSGETVMNSRQDSQDENAVPVDEVVQSRLNEGNGVWGWIRKSDGIGGHKFGAGEWAYNHLANATRAVFDAIDRASGNNFNLNMASKEFRQAFRRYRADVDNARSDIANAAQAMQSMSEEERRLVSDVIEKMVTPGVNPPEHVLQVAASIQNLMDAQTDELVRLGLLSAESAERWRGQYLPRVYLKQTELFEEAKKNFWKIFGSGEGLRGGHLKGRGIFRTVVGNQAIAQHKALGWEIRDLSWSDAQGELQFKGEGAEPRTPTVVMWRDFTPEERRQMGECRDAMVRMVMGYMQTQEDIALARFFDSLSRDTRFAASVPSEDWVRVPDTSIGNGSNVKRFGALAGMYVAPEVWAEIQHLKRDPNIGVRLARTMLAAWKEGKTALNPVAHTNNTVGNIAMAYFAGVNALDPRTYMRAFKDMRSNAEMFQEAQRAGLLSGNFSRTEMLEMIPLDELRSKLTGMKPGYEKIIDAFMEISSLGLRKKLRSAYETEDTVFKYIIYKHARENGMSVEDAVDYAGHYIFNYDDLPSGARRIRDSLLPFFSWTYKAVPTLLYTAMVYPHRYLAPMAMVFAVNKAAYLAIAAASSAGGDDWEDIFEKAAKLEDAEREALPEYAQGRSIFLTQKMIRTWNNSDGTANFLDMSRLLPGGDLIDVNNQMGGIPWMQTLMPNSPQLGLFMALFANKDPFTGREVVDDTASFGEAFRKRLGYFYKNIAPAIAPGGYHVSRLADGIAAATDTTLTIDPVMDITGTDWNGRKMELSRALAHTFGIKMRSFNWDQEVQRKTQKMAGEISDKRRQVNYSAKAAYRGAVSPEAYRNFVRRTVEDVKERADQLQKFREKVKPLLPEKPRP